MIKGQLNKAIKSTKAFHEYQETKTKMSKHELESTVKALEDFRETLDNCSTTK